MIKPGLCSLSVCANGFLNPDSQAVTNSCMINGSDILECITLKLNISWIFTSYKSILGADPRFSERWL